MATPSIWSITTIHLMCDNLLSCGRTIMCLNPCLKSSSIFKGWVEEKLILTTLLNLVSSLPAVYKDNSKKK